MARYIVIFSVLMMLIMTTLGQGESADTIFLPKNTVSSFDADYSAESVTYEDLGIFSSAQLPEILNSESFAQFGNLSIEGYSYPYINGIPGIFAGVYLDGVRLYGPNSGPFDLKWFPMEMLSRATVVTGGMISPDGMPVLGGGVDIDVHEKPVKRDYTRLAGGFGNNDNRDYSGMFIKSFNEYIGVGVSAEEVSEENMGFDSREVRNRHFSGIIWSGFGDFDLRLFGFRFEGLNTDMGEEYNDSLDYVRDEGDHRFFDAKLSYAERYTIRYNHQDYLQTKYIQDNLGFDKSHVKTDGVIATADLPIPKAWNNTLRLRGDWTLFSNNSGGSDEYQKWKAGGSLVWGYDGEGTSLRLGLRAEYLEDEDYTVFPEISLSKSFGKTYTIFAGGGMGDILRVYGLYPILSDSNRFYTAEAGLEYRQADELSFVLKGYYTETGLFSYSICHNDLSWELTEDVYGVQSKIELTPDELFVLGARYVWSSSKNELAGLPEHFIQAYAQEKRFYDSDDFSVTLRLEADGYLNLPADAPDMAILRTRINAAYLGVSLFGSYEYALVKDEGWHNRNYVLTTLMPGTRWRFGASWELID
ncbi:MAG: TonB-dependent receptor plug domain-containing protein [bacterium]